MAALPHSPTEIPMKSRQPVAASDYLDLVTARHGSIPQGVPPSQRTAGVPQAPDAEQRSKGARSAGVYNIYV